MRFCAVLLAAVLVSTNVKSTTFHIPEQLNSIQQAINRCSDGDSILVRPGNYVENIDFLGKSISLVSTDGAQETSLSPYSSGFPVIRLVGGEKRAAISGFMLRGGSYTNVVLINSHAYACITDCIITGYSSGEVAIRCDTDSSVISHNLFYGNGGISSVGIYSGSAEISNNTFDDNNRGFFCLSGLGIGRNNLVTNSHEYGIAGSFVALEYNDVWYNQPNYESGARAGVGSLSIDPVYWDVANRDYRLKPASPCIDAGDPNPRYNDLDGTRCDIGAYGLNYGELPHPRLTITPTSTSGLTRSLTPTISWEFVDIEGSEQVAYALEVGTDWDWTEAELWSTGEIASTDTSVVYGGLSLADGETYVVRVRVSNGDHWGEWAEETIQIVLGQKIRVPMDYSTIQSAVAAASESDSVIVYPGVYSEQVNFSGKNITVTSAFGPTSTILRKSNFSFHNSETSASVVSGFTFCKGSTPWISIGSNASPTIANNIFTDFQGDDNTGFMINLNGGQPTLIHNLFYDNPRGFVCIASYAPAAPRILNNTFVNNPRGFFCTGPAIALNNIIANSKDYGIWGNHYAVQDYNLVWGNSPDYYSGAIAGAHNLNAEPLFVDAAVHEFSLMPESPCIDAGDPDDIFRDPDSTRADIGAIYYDALHPVRVTRISFIPANPGLVLSLVPTITWKVKTTSGSQQIAYEIEVGTDADWSVAELWQTGTVSASATSTQYQGAPLSDGDICYVRIRVFDGANWSTWTPSGFLIRLPRVLRVPEEVLQIQSAISRAVDGDTILVSPGTYSETFNYAGKGVVVTSAKGPDSTIFTPPGTVIADFNQQEPEGAVLSGFTFTGYLSGPFVYVRSGAYPTISDNYFKSAHVPGFTVVIATADADPLITRNVFYDCTGLGAVFVERGTARILNNTFDNNDIGVYAAIFTKPGLIENNIFSRSRITGILRSSATIRYNDFWQNARDIDAVTGPDTLHASNVFVDPAYVDPLAFNYHLDGSSLCIDAGDPDTSFNDPDHSRSDIGAFQFIVQSGVFVRVFRIENEEFSHVRTAYPKFVWLPVAAGAASQMEYHLMVGSDDDWSTAECWDTGPVAARDTTLLYNGLPLQRGRQYWVRLRVSDGTTWSDWRQFAFKFNSLPNAPMTISPPAAVIREHLPNYKAQSAGDSDGDNLTFEFMVALDSNLARGYDSSNAIHPSSSGLIEWSANASLSENGGYWWSVRAWDGFEYSAWAPPVHFWVNVDSEPMIYLMLLYPGLLEYNAIPLLTPRLIWSTAEDADPGSISRYRLDLAQDSLFNVCMTVENLLDTSLQLTTPLQVNTAYWWRVSARNQDGDSIQSPEGKFWTWKQGDIDLSRKIDLQDLSTLIAYLLHLSSELDCSGAADLSGDCLVDLSDLSAMIGYLVGNTTEFRPPCISSGNFKPVTQPSKQVHSQQLQP